MRKYVILGLINLLVVCLLGCANENEDSYVADYDDAKRATVFAWERLIDRVSDQCYAELRRTKVSEVTIFPSNCVASEGMRVVGCYISAANMVLISALEDEYRKADIAVHEFIHALSLCETGDPQGDHSDERLWNEFGTNTVEVWGCAGLEY